LVNLVGAWHSHPHGPIEPSDTDLGTMRDLVGDAPTDLSEAVLVIVGGDENSEPHVQVFTGQGG
jgi:proteasome lid subunit RPN8/RPN11